MVIAISVIMIAFTAWIYSISDGSTRLRYCAKSIIAVILLILVCFETGVIAAKYEEVVCAAIFLLPVFCILANALIDYTASVIETEKILQEDAEKEEIARRASRNLVKELDGCGICKYFQPNESGRYFEYGDRLQGGVCRRYAPTVYRVAEKLSDPGVDVHSYQAPVLSSYWCGDFVRGKPRETAR